MITIELWNSILQMEVDHSASFLQSILHVECEYVFNNARLLICHKRTNRQFPSLSSLSSPRSFPEGK